MWDDNRINYRHDYSLLQWLNKYGVRIRKIADFLNISYSAAYSAMMKSYGEKSNKSWIINSISDNDLNILTYMINEHIEQYNNNDIAYYWLISPRSLNKDPFILLIRSGHRTVYAYIGIPKQLHQRALSEWDDFQQNEREQLLADIRKIRGELQATKNSTKRTKRCIELVNKLKLLYKDKCQLCNPENPIPYIVLPDGFYVEMHHIKPISTAKDPQPNEQEDTDLDTDQNAVIVCPHHHKVLHYHEGGCDSLLIDKSSKLYFQSKLGTFFPLFLNYHLTHH